MVETTSTVRRIVFLLPAVVVMLVAAVCAPGVSPEPLTAEKELELQTLKDQLSDPTRSQKTRLESARLLLSKRYPEAIAALQQFLADSSNPGAQRAVAEAIAENGGGQKEFIKLLLQMLIGDEPSVRPAAAQAMAAYSNNGVTNRLIGVARDTKLDRAVRVVTIKALSGVITKPCIQVLIDLLGDPDPTIRSAAVESLKQLTNIRRFGSSRLLWQAWWRKNRDKDQLSWLKEIADGLIRARMALEKENTQLRERLIKAMEDLYNTSAKTQRPQIVLGMLKDSLGDVRLLGATLTDKMIASNEKIPPELRQRVRVMLSDTDPRVRQAAAMLEASLPDPKTTDLLLRRLSAEKIPDVRVGLLKALGLLKSSEALLSAVLGEIHTQDNDEAAAAAEALRRIVADKPLNGKQKTEAGKVLIQRYEQASAEKNGVKLREALLTAMGVLGDPSAVGVLKEALKDPAGIIRLAGVAGLSHLEARDAAPLIVPLIVDADRGVRQAGIAALAKLGGQDYLQTILQRTDAEVESDPTVRKEAVDSVLAICRKADADIFTEVLKNLREQKETAALRIQILQLYVAALKAAKSPLTMEVLRDLGGELVKADRADEAVPIMAEAYALLGATSRPSSNVARQVQQSVWFDYLAAMLAANDPGFAKVLDDRPKKDESNSFQTGIELLRKRLGELMKEAKYLPLISLTKAALGQLDERLAPKDKEYLQGILQRAEEKQLALDRLQVEKLFPQLSSADVASRTEAQDQLKTMNARAVQPLLELLKTTVSADTPDPKAEKTIFEILHQIAPNLGEYDPSAQKVLRLKLIETWLKGARPS